MVIKNVGKYVEVEITPRLQSWAEKYVKENKFPVDFEDKNTIYTGRLGEGIFACWANEYKIIGKFKNTYEYDSIVYLQTGDTVTIEVKAMSWYSIPRDYHCFLNARCRIQKCDYYVFTTIDEDGRISRILGYLPTQEYARIHRFTKAGDVVYKCQTLCDNYVIDFGQIRPIEEFKNMVLKSISIEKRW